MRYHNITKDDMLNGDGLRVVLWVAGCEHHCPNCQNPVTWDINGGLEFDEAAKKEIFDELEKNYVSGITFSGGDPMYQPEGFTELACAIKEKSNKNIWCYTGYTFETLLRNPLQAKLLQYIDVLVDGEFKEALKDVTLVFRGSQNQRIINVKESKKQGKVVLEDY